MRKSIFAVLTAMFVALSGMVAASVLAKPVPAAPVTFPVGGTFSTTEGEEGVPFTGTVTVDSFVEQEGELAVQGTLAVADDALFAPLPITIAASARASDDTGSGCVVDISTANFFDDSDFIIFLDGAGFTLSGSAEPEVARELCRVVRTATRDPADQSALARALNKVLR
jgi:hypothetical protein